MKNIKLLRLFYIILAVITGISTLLSASFFLACIFVFFVFMIVFYTKQLKKYESQVPSQTSSIKLNPVPTPRYNISHDYYSIYDQNDSVIKEFYKYHKEDFEEDDEYGLSSAKLKEELYYEDRLFKYAPYYEGKFYIKDNLIFVDVDDEGNYKQLGELKQSDLEKINQATSKQLVYYHGDYKFYDYDEDAIVKSKIDSYFRLYCEIKKRHIECLL